MNRQDEYAALRNALVQTILESLQNVLPDPTLAESAAPAVRTAVLWELAGLSVPNRATQARLARQGRVYRLRGMGLTLEVIAKREGVSKATAFRDLRDALLRRRQKVA